jgi:hypothetical protein
MEPMQLAKEEWQEPRPRSRQMTRHRNLKMHLNIQWATKRKKLHLFEGSSSSLVVKTSPESLLSLILISMTSSWSLLKPDSPRQRSSSSTKSSTTAETFKKLIDQRTKSISRSSCESLTKTNKSIRKCHAGPAALS